MKRKIFGKCDNSEMDHYVDFEEVNIIKKESIYNKIKKYFKFLK